MRLERLEVTGFGPLAGIEVDLHPRITVVVGDNESGKSSVLRALRAALYGVDAGGQGRPTDRSDWARWTPWGGGPYGVALTYALADGRRVRVARRLDNREHVCQVQHLGGADITAQVRVGRTVAPGHVHLGIDEAVFCATACAGDDGLRLGAPDAPSQRAPAVQEAIERLADSGADTTTTEALAALREARTRVGSERRLGSPLGAAINRIRQLDIQIADARGQVDRLAHEEERLRDVEAQAVAAAERRLDAERRWLVGRLAAIAQQQRDLDGAAQELTDLAAQIEVHADLAAFPADAEDRVVALAAGLGEATRNAAEAEARAAAVADDRERVLRRIAEIDSGVAALGAVPAVGEDLALRVGALREDLAALLGDRRHGEQLSGAAVRRDALRREVAATGLGAVGPGAVDRAADLVEAVRHGGRWQWLRRVSSAVATAGVALAAVGFAAGRTPMLGLGVVLAAGGFGLALFLERSHAGSGAAAAVALRRLCPGIELDDAGLERLRAGLPRLAALYREIAQQEVRIETLADDVASAETSLVELALRAQLLADESGVAVAPAATAEARVRAVLAAFDTAIGTDRRREQLAAERELLVERRRGWDALIADAAERRAAAAETRARLAQLLQSGGIELGDHPGEAVRRFREQAEKRRRRERALQRREEVSRRTGALDPDHLARLQRQLQEQLLARGGSLDEVAGAEPLAAHLLADLEFEAQHAAQSAVVAASDATALSARIAEMRRTAPPLADLEDERAACVAARDRALHQLAALDRAAELLETATSGVHRDLAPRLASAVEARLGELTEGRYSTVNVDTAHFAVSVLGRERPDLVPVELLSHGTRDQVSLLLRIALAEVLSGAGEPVPLLLDEPLLSSDAGRRATALRFLWNVSATNQVVLTTSDPSVIGELTACAGGEEPTVVVMAATTPVVQATGRLLPRAIRVADWPPPPVTGATPPAPGPRGQTSSR